MSVATSSAHLPAAGHRAGLSGPVSHHPRSAEIAASITAEMGSPTKFAKSVQVGMPMATSKGVAGLAESFPWTEEIGKSLVVREQIGEVEDRPFHAYAEACAATLARAHAQSPSAPVVAGYLGSGRVAGEALAEWAYAYAQRSRADYEAFVAAA